MKVNGKSKTPITAAQAKKKTGESGGTKARTSQQTSKKKLGGVKTAVLDRISDGLLALDAGMNYTYLNERAGELLGRSAEELIGKNLREEYSGADRTPFMEACQRALETQSVVWLNEYFPAADRWLEGRIYPSEDGVSVLFTEGLEQRSVEVEDRYRILVESMQETFFLADVLTDEQGQPHDYRFVDVNAAIEKLLGKSRRQIIGQTIRELLPLTPRDLELVKRIAAVGLGSEPFFIDQYSESMQRWFRSHFFSPRAGQVFGMSLDVSESKQAEERIREISMFPEQNPNPVMRLSREGEVLYANQASDPLLAVWENTKGPVASLLKIREQLTEALGTGSNREVEVENQGKVFTCLLVPFPEAGYVNLYFRDITERKQVEGTLHAIVNQAGAGITCTDLEGRHTFVNQAFCDMLGYSEMELSGMSIWEMSDSETQTKERRLFGRMLSTGEGYQVEKRMIRRNGVMIWVSVGMSPLRDTDARITGGTAVIVDITRRKRAEESLLDTARRSLFLSSLSDTLRLFDTPSKIEVEAACLLGAHLKASRVVYVEVDPDGQFQVGDGYVDEIQQLYGVFSLADFVPQEQMAKLQAGRLFTTPDVEKDSRLSELQRSTLEKFLIRAQMILPFTRENRVTAALLIQQAQPRKWKEEEISLVEEAAERLQAAAERAQAEARLRDSEKRFRILANAAPSIVWTSTPEGTLLYVNDRWYDFTGIPPQKGRPLWTDLKLHPEDAPRFFQEMMSIKSSRAEAVTEVRIQRRDGEYRWFQTRAVPTLDESGNVTAWHGLLTDIHDRVERDAEQRKVIDGTPFMLTRCSRDLRYQFVSRAYAEMIGKTPEQLIGRPIVEILGEKGLQTILPHVERVLQGERVEYEEQVSFASGHTPYLHAAYTPDLDEQGNVIGWFASIIDMTERRRMEESLRESEHKFNIIFHKLPFTALLLRPEDNVIVDANEEFETVFGYTRQEILGRTTFALDIESNPEDRAHILAVLQANVAIRDMELQFNTRLHGLRTFLISTDVVNIGGSDYILQIAQDITERRQAEQEAQKARLQAEHENLQLKTLLENLPVGVMVTDTAGTPLLMNPALDEIWQGRRTLESLPNYNTYRAWRAETGEPVGPKDWPISLALHTGETQPPREFKIERFDGSMGTMLSAAAPIRDRTGKIIRAVAVAQDITERKQMEQALAREQELLERLFKSIPVMMTFYDPETGKSRVNSYFERLTGWKNSEDLTPQSLVEACYPDPGYRMEVIQRLAASLEGEWVDARMWKQDGGTIDTTWTRLSFTDGMQVGLGIDITERKLAEQALRSSEERMRLAIESNRMVAWEWDPQADHVTTSDNFAEVYGLASVTSAPEGFALIWPQDLPAHREKVDQVMHSGGEYRSEFRITRPVDGRTLWLEERGIALVGQNGQITRLVGIVIDITERKRAEQELAEFARQQQALYKLADQLSSAGSLEEMYNPALDAILNALQCDRASILLFDQQDVMSFVAWRGLSEEYRRATNGHSPWTRAEKNARPISMDDVANADLSDSLRATIQAEGIGALAFIPLIIRGNLIGKFMVYFNRPHVFDESEVSLAQTIAHQLASQIERKWAAEELRQSKQRLSLTYRHAPIGIVETRLDGRFLEVNNEFCKMLGYSYDELIKLGIAEVTEKDDRQVEMELYRQLVNDEIPFYRMEKRFIRKDGTQLWGEIVRTMLHDENGRPLYGIGGVLNITERKQKEEELRARTEEISALMEVSPIGIFVAHDQGCTRITANPAGYHLVEMSEDSSDNVSKSATEHERPTYRTFRNGVELKPEDLPMQVAARLGMEIEEETLELRFENGAQKYIYAYAKPLFDARGKVRGAIASMLDISQRMQREEEIRARTEEIETLMEVSPIGIMVAHDPQCNRITGNPAANVILGLPQEVDENLANPVLAEKGTPHWVYREGLQLDVPDLPMQMAARLGIEVKDETLELRFADGAQKYIYLYAKPLFDSQGKSRGAIAALLDVTERRRNEQALQESEERFSKAFRASPDAVTISRTSDGLILEVNNSWSSLFGYEAEEAVGKTSQELNLFTDPQVRNRAVNLLQQEGSVRDFEVDVRRKSGEVRHALLAVESIEINGVECLISIMRDITERKLAEIALRQSEERFAQFMQHFPGHAWIKDLQGRYVYANAAVFKTYNLSPAELYGKRDMEVFPENVAAQFVSTDEVALEEKGTQIVQQSNLDSETVGHSLITKFPIPGPDGRPALVGGTAIDITERVQMEQALRVARAQAEKTAYRMTQLQKITAAISQAVTPTEIAQMVVEQGAPVLGAIGSSIMLLNEDRHALEMIFSSVDKSITNAFTRIPLEFKVPVTDAVHSAQPVWIESYDQYLERYPSLADQIKSWNFEAALAFPMIYKGRVLGTLSLSFDRPLPFSPEDQEYLLTLARQAAQAFERARVETALRLDAAMMENVPAGIYLVRASDGTIVHTNPQLDKLFGYEPGEVIGRQVSVLNAENLHAPEEVDNGIINILRKEGSWQGEILSKRKDGTTFWCYASVTTFDHDTHGTVWVAARQDITERKQIEEALGESEQRYRAIVSQATAGIVRKDKGGRLLFVNKAFCDLLGMSEAELKGRRIWELTHPEDVGENKRLYDRLMLQGIPFQFEKRLLHRNGSLLWVSVSVSPVMDANGRTTSAVSVYVDITGRKQAEERLSLLTTVSELAREIEDPDDLMFAVSRLVGEHFQVKRALFNEIDLENDLETIHRDYCRQAKSVAGVHKISAYSNVTTAEMMAGKTVVNRDSKVDPRTAVDYERSYVQYGERAYVAIPLMRDERWVASLWISDDQPRDWGKKDIDLLEGIAERTWMAAEKMRVDRALRDSEERLRVTFNTTVVGFAALRPDTRFTEVNDAYCRIVGYSREELLQMEYGSLVHPRFIEETTQLLAGLIADEVSSFIIEKIFVRRDGTEIWVQNSLSLVRDANGTPLHLIAICQDVTERKRAEEALHQLNLELEERVKRRTIELQVANEFLRESEATSRLILESMPDAIVIIDRDGQIVHANTQVETLFGYTPGEVMGQPVETLVPQRYKTRHEQERLSYGEQRNRRIMALGQELFGRRKDESEFPVEVMLAPIDNSTNWDVLVAIRDNTRQREAQEALRSNEEKLRTVFELLPVGVSFLDKEGRVSELNSALTEILGMPRSQILSGKYQSRRFIRADGSPMPPSEFASTRARQEKKNIYNVETGIVKENGEIIWTSVNAAPIQVADVEAAIVTIDITERKKAEEALHKNRERLRVLSRRLVEVQEEERHAIARELHDRVGQNLAALTLNLNILRNQLSSEVLDKVGTRLNDSVNLVKDILTITRSVMADLRPNVLDDYGLDAAINEYAERFTQRYGIRVITHTPVKATPRLDPGVEMTLLRIVQEALTNIARHAQATQAVMTLEFENNEVLMTVEDNGQGIMSWQKVNQPGSHGLRIMRERAEAFGGSLKINSTYKNGTKIEVKIPLASSVPGNGRKEKKS